MALGSYSEFRNVNEEDKKIFDQVIIDIDGIGYEPFAVATQLVNGVNYKFLCNATAITTPPLRILGCGYHLSAI